MEITHSFILIPKNLHRLPEDTIKELIALESKRNKAIVMWSNEDEDYSPYASLPLTERQGVHMLTNLNSAKLQDRDIIGVMQEKGINNLISIQITSEGEYQINHTKVYKYR